MTTPLKIMSVVGARPNLMKIAPFLEAVNRHNLSTDTGRKITHCLVHTGQHYDPRMSGDFFTSLGIPEPDLHLEIGSGTHAEQVGRTMMAFEPVVRDQKPDWIVVVGDVNATCACAITAKKEWVKLAHIEAGLRSSDQRMPEEINRLVTDRLSDLLLTPDLIASENLRREGCNPAQIRHVGNIMIDTLVKHLPKAAEQEISSIIAAHGIAGQEQPPVDAFTDRGYAVMTLHRPSNVDLADVLGRIVKVIETHVATDLPVIWSVHPRTRQNLEEFGLWQGLLAAPRMVLLDPVGYHEMLRLSMGARLMLTDSGGLQEETCVLGTPCLTMRENTERPVTLRENGGLSLLVGNDPERIREGFAACMRLENKPSRPELWDGQTADRIVKCILDASPSD